MAKYLILCVYGNQATAAAFYSVPVGCCLNCPPRNASSSEALRD